MAERGVTIEELDEATCVELLGAHHFGRIAVVVEGSPVIFPVNYLYQDGRVAIRTDPGTKLTAAAMGSVAFEIDEVDDQSHTGWSVLVTGRGFDVSDALDHVSEEIRSFPVDTWAPGDKASWIRIEPLAVTGRRIVSAR